MCNREVDELIITKGRMGYGGGKGEVSAFKTVTCCVDGRLAGS